MAFVLPFASGTRRTHRVYAKGMFVTDREDRILPEWAFFVRAIVDSDHLSLTASREGLHDDDILHEAAERLGEQLRRWLLRMAASDPSRMREFLRVHHLGVKAMAVDDPDMLDLVGGLLPWQTTLGELTLAEFAAESPVIQYVSTTSDFQQVSGLAQSLGLPVLNAGYAYDEAILRNWLRHHPEHDAKLVQPRDLTGQFDELDDADRRRFAPLLDVAEETLGRAGCAPLLRSFRPEGRHAVFLTDRSSLEELDRAEIRQRTTGPWGTALDSIARPDDRPAFVLNAANPSVRRLADADPHLQRVSVEALYAHALVAAQQPLRAFDNALVARALPALIDRAIDGVSS
jgi:molecular chaperone HtpG